MIRFEITIEEEAWQLPNISDILEDLEEVIGRHGLSLFSAEYEEE